MRRRKCPPFLAALLVSLLAVPPSRAGDGKTSLVNLVDTRIGTAAAVTAASGTFGRGSEEYGQTVPAVLEPNGMTFWTPQTRATERKCVAPYYYADSLFQGFRASHWLTGGCTQDYGSVTLMPLYGRLRCGAEERAARFSHESETARPCFYEVELPGENIRAGMTARARTAIFRFVYGEGGKGYLVVEPNSDEGEGSVEIDTLEKTITGSNPVHRIYQGWGEKAGYSGHFLVRFEKEAASFGVFSGDTVYAGASRISGRGNIGAYIEFSVAPGEEVLAKASVSFADEAGAAGNMEAEIPHWDFDRTEAELEASWNERLSLVEVESDSREELEKFYSALYRASFLPRLLSDADGRCPSFSTGLPLRQLPEGGEYYDDYSLWDTFRALHPLWVLLTPARSGRMMQSLVDKYEEGGWLPIFPCWNSYTAAMIGDHATAAICDAYVKGVGNFDIPSAYEAMRKNAFGIPSRAEYRDGKGRRALESYLRYGYIPLEDSVPEAFHTREQVSRTMEYAFDDFALSQMARGLGREDDFAELRRRALNYRNVIDPRTGYASGRHASGAFAENQNPFDFAPYITEGAPCHYTWFAPQDAYGLMEIMGGKDAFAAKLDSMFSAGRYWHGNEPCHQVAFMYNYAGQPWKTSLRVRRIMETEYLNCPGGLSGNDDAGQMSAWYVFAAMGFYPACPASPYYMLSGSVFPLVRLRPEGGKQFVIKSDGASGENIYIQSAVLNGEPYTRNYISHEDLARGGVLEVVMGPEPNPGWGSAPEDCPPDLMKSPEIVR